MILVFYVASNGQAQTESTNVPPVYIVPGLHLHPPAFESDSVRIVFSDTLGSQTLTNRYDLFCAPRVDATNWSWLARSSAGGTWFVVSHSDYSQCFFLLGTMQDSDADGLTDAYEMLTSHTDPEDPADGGGLPDAHQLITTDQNQTITDDQGVQIAANH